MLSVPDRNRSSPGVSSRAARCPARLLLPLPLGKLKAAVSTFPDKAALRNWRWNGLKSNIASKDQVPFCDSRAKTKMKFQGSLPIIFISDFHFLYPAMSIKFAEACHCVCP